MSRIRAAAGGFLAATICCPTAAWATQGPVDIAMGVSIVLFAFPAFFTMIGFSIYSVVKLCSKRKQARGSVPVNPGRPG